MRERDDLVFPMVEYRRRLTELRQRMETHNLDAVITTTPENICYLSGFESPGHYYFNALIIPHDGEPIAVPRQLEDSGVQELTWIENSQPYQDHEHPIDKLTDVLKANGFDGQRIGIERGCWFFTALQQEKLFAQCPNITFIDCTGMVEQGRVIKSDYEIDLMRKVAKTSEAGMRAGIEAVATGVNENDIAAEMNHAMIKAGSEWPSIVPFVASGYRGAIGHATWAGRTVESGDIIMLEISGCLKRYHAAIMRTGFVGEPGKMVRDAEKRVLEAFEAMREVIKPGVPAGDPDAAARRILSDGSSTQASRSAYSIGIGLPPDWGEGHILSMQTGEQRLLQENMTFHMLPWIQVPGKGGISISETIRVTADGCELLTNFDREIFVK